MEPCLSLALRTSTDTSRAEQQHPAPGPSPAGAQGNGWRRRPGRLRNNWWVQRDLKPSRLTGALPAGDPCGLWLLRLHLQAGPSARRTPAAALGARRKSQRLLTDPNHGRGDSQALSPPSSHRRQPLWSPSLDPGGVPDGFTCDGSGSLPRCREAEAGTESKPRRWGFIFLEVYGKGPAARWLLPARPPAPAVAAWR